MTFQTPIFGPSVTLFSGSAGSVKLSLFTLIGNLTFCNCDDTGFVTLMGNTGSSFV